jgi:hypothetical protein
VFPDYVCKKGNNPVSDKSDSRMFIILGSSENFMRFEVLTTVYLKINIF